MTQGLHRYYGTQDLHFITCSCYHRLPKLAIAERRDLFARILEETRYKYRFVIHGYVIMPEHFHFLITEPEEGDPGVVMKVIKERFARQVNRALDELSVSAHANDWCPNPEREPVWQKRFYDFNIWSGRKRIEKIHYMHMNPGTCGKTRAVEGGAVFAPTITARSDRCG